MDSFIEEDSEIIPCFLPIPLKSDDIINTSISKASTNEPITQEIRSKNLSLNVSFPSLFTRIGVRKTNVYRKLKPYTLTKNNGLEKSMKYSDRGYKARGFKKPWTFAEELLLIDMVEKCGKNWQELYYYFPGRTNVDLKDKWRNVMNKKGIIKELKTLDFRENECTKHKETH